MRPSPYYKLAVEALLAKGSDSISFPFVVTLEGVVKTTTGCLWWKKPSGYYANVSAPDRPRLGGHGIGETPEEAIKAALENLC